LREAHTCRYLVYSEANFEVFRPAGATRCTDGGEIWPKFGEKSENSGIFIPILNLLVAISNGIWAVKLCSNNFLYLLSGVAG